MNPKHKFLGVSIIVFGFSNLWAGSMEAGKPTFSGSMVVNTPVTFSQNGRFTYTNTGQLVTTLTFSGAFRYSRSLTPLTATVTVNTVTIISGGARMGTNTVSVDPGAVITGDLTTTTKYTPTSTGTIQVTGTVEGKDSNNSEDSPGPSSGTTTGTIKPVGTTTPPEEPR